MSGAFLQEKTPCLGLQGEGLSQLRSPRCGVGGQSLFNLSFAFVSHAQDSTG